MQIVQINDVRYIQGVLWPLIVELADRLNTPGITAHSVMAYILYGQGVEVWGAVKEDNEPMGFIVFQQLGPPYVSTGHAGFFYMKDKDSKARDALISKFFDFLKANKLLYWNFSTHFERLAQHFLKKAKEFEEITLLSQSYTYQGRRRIGGA